jgi:xanthine dehydrogenase YagR molybdenum-binding subunit
MGLAPNKITVQMGSTGLPPGPMQGGSTVTSTVGSAVHDACLALKEEVAAIAGKESLGFRKANTEQLKAEDLVYSESGISLKKSASTKVSYSDLFKQNQLPTIEVTKESKGKHQPYSSYSFSVHFVKLRVHHPTGRIKIDHVVSCADAGTIVSAKTAEGQMIGGAVGGIGMALMEDLVIDHRFGRPINNNLADYHVPVNADIPITRDKLLEA